MKSDIGLPDDMSRDDAYIQGIADTEQRASTVIRGLISLINESLDTSIGEIEELDAAYKFLGEYEDEDETEAS
jgi:hypothetical protein